MKEAKVQWHPGFVAAMGLELAGNRDDLIFEKEYNLNTKPLEIDLLVVRKHASASISNEIGKLFKGHNIIEYKSPEDHLDIDAFYKSGAYASLYKSYGKTVDGIKADDITVSIVREARPAGLFRYLKGQGYPMSNPYRGIYYIEGKVLFPTQIIVTGELEKEGHIWLKALSGKLGKEDMRNLLDGVSRLTEKMDKELADSVLEVSVGANKRIVKELIGDDNMCQALMEIMEPLMQQRDEENIEKGIKKGIEKGIKKGIEKGKVYGMVSAYRDLGVPENEILKKVQEKLQLSLEEAKEYL